jgi:hypothetical protein
MALTDDSEMLVVNDEVDLGSDARACRTPVPSCRLALERATITRRSLKLS